MTQKCNRWLCKLQSSSKGEQEIECRLPFNDVLAANDGPSAFSWISSSWLTETRSLRTYFNLNGFVNINFSSSLLLNPIQNWTVIIENLNAYGANINIGVKKVQLSVWLNIRLAVQIFDCTGRMYISMFNPTVQFKFSKNIFANKNSQAKH